MNTEIKIRRGTKETLETLNPVPHSGEEVLEVLSEEPDGSIVYPVHPATGRPYALVKYGDGRTPWKDLPYTSGPPGPAGGGGGADIPDATTTVPGKLRYATEDEAKALAVGYAALTPKALGAVKATETSFGLAQFAAATNFTSADKAATPAGVATAIANINIPLASPATAGLIKVAAGADITSADKAATPLLVQNVLKATSGGSIEPWLPSKDYPTGPRFVWGSDAKLYQWLAASGPGTEAGPRDPATPPEVVQEQSLTLSAWASSTLPSSGDWINVALNDNGRAVSVIMTSASAAYSADSGRTWTAATMPSSASWFGVSINNDGRAVAVAQAAGKAAYSTNNGQTWAAATLPSTSVAYSGVAINANGQAATVAIGPTTAAAYSVNNGQTWAAAAMPVSGNWYNVALNDSGRAVSVARDSASAAYSTDGGKTWAAATLPSSAGWRGVGLNNNKQAVAVTHGSTNKAAWSEDGGKTWAAATLPENGDWFVVSLNDDGWAVAVAYASNRAAYSTDGGKTWAASTLPSSAGWRGVGLNNNKQAVAVASASNQAATSSFPVVTVVHWPAYWAAYETTPVGENVVTTGRAAPRDCIPYDGGLYSRAEYPALWKFIEAFCQPVADGSWTAAKYSTGDGAATFRVPKLTQTDATFTSYIKAR